jgi:hypothetical protein
MFGSSKKERLHHQHASLGGRGVGGTGDSQKFRPHKKVGLEHWISLNLVMELLKMSSLKEGGVEAVGEHPPQEGSPQNNVTAGYIRKEGTNIPNWLFRTKRLKQGIM